MSLHSLHVKLRDFQTVLPIARLCRAGHTLKKLNFTDFVREGIKPVSFDDLHELQELCPLLENLEMDLPAFPYKDLNPLADRLTFKAQEAFQLLAAFRNLTKLSLYCEQSLGTADPINSSRTDPDYEDAQNIMRALHKNKIGKVSKD